MAMYFDHTYLGEFSLDAAKPAKATKPRAYHLGKLVSSTKRSSTKRKR